MDDESNSQPHDGLFRGAIARLEDARSALEAAMPTGLAAALDLDRLALVPARIVDVVLRPGESDALFEVPVRGSDVSVVIYFPVEHQSKSDLDMPLRLLRTKLRLWEKQRDEGLPLSPVIPVVVSHGRPWSGPRSMLARLALPEEIATLVAPYTPQCTYMLDDLARYGPAELARRPILTSLVRASYFLLQIARESAALEKELPLILGDLSRVARGPGAVSILIRFSRYTLLVANGDNVAIRAQLREAIGPDLGESVMGTVAEQLIERGRVEGEARGRVEGEARGRVEGEARGRVEGETHGRVKVLTQLLELKFGKLDQRTLDLLATASIESLDAYTTRVLSAISVEDVFRD